jgi:hypothetical protein
METIAARLRRVRWRKSVLVIGREIGRACASINHSVEPPAQADNNNNNNDNDNNNNNNNNNDNDNNDNDNNDNDNNDNNNNNNRRVLFFRSRPSHMHAAASTAQCVVRALIVILANECQQVSPKMAMNGAGFLASGSRVMTRMRDEHHVCGAELAGGARRETGRSRPRRGQTPLNSHHRPDALLMAPTAWPLSLTIRS